MKFLLLSLLALVSHRVHGDALDEDFGYVDVRTGAHMFWVVYHTELPGDWTEHPLIMWLQGGPGGSGVGFGNFQELGPYDINGNLKPGRWTQKANLMFVDNPVGTGYSYVDNSQYCTDNAQIADDLVTLITSVFNQYPDMQVMPFFVYAESYGGKMTADFAIALDKAIANGDITCNFQGIAMGDSWISPMDSVNTWGPYLYGMGFVNRDGEANINAAAQSTQNAVDNGRWTQATNEWGNTEGVVGQETDGVDFYNVLVEDSSIYESTVTLADQRKYSYMPQEVRNLYFRHVKSKAADDLSSFMNGPQAEHWDIPNGVEWGGQSGNVFNELSADFMKPVVDSVASLLNNSKIHVAVYTGDLDLICDTPGTYRWIEGMNYGFKSNFDGTARKALTIPDYPNNAAYVQRYERFSIFTILRSGHMTPIDAPTMALSMVDMITEYGSETVASKSKTEKLLNKVEKVHAALKEEKKDDKDVKEEAKELVAEKKEEIKDHENSETKKQIVEEKIKEKEEKHEHQETKQEVIAKVEETKEHAKQTKEDEENPEQIKEKVNELVQQKENEQKKAEIKEKVEEIAKLKTHPKHSQVHNTKAEKEAKEVIEQDLKMLLSNKNADHKHHPNAIVHH